ncbi:MAG: histidinol-phosphate aminotransferase family protein [Candidatus Daviesbacteria bacterium]|nr:MAG: histidinol-phosphate aminotransferase family protein [Candidatus Daviesbacteria bacterium]
MKTVLDFAQNINVLGCPPAFFVQAQDLINSALHYPDAHSESVSRDIAVAFDLAPDGVIFCNGSTEALFILPRFLNKKISLIPYPTFWEYSLASQKAGHKINILSLVEAENFVLNLPILESQLTPNTVVYLCNPNNPTSTLIEREKILTIIKDHPNTCFVVDETYLIFRQDYSQLTLTSLAQNLDNLFVVTSFSKVFAVPGIRSAFLVSSPLNIAKYKEFHIPYSTNAFSEKVTSWLVKQTTHLTKTRKFFLQARPDTYKLFQDKFYGLLQPFVPEANFILLKILVNKTSTKVASKLKEQGFLVRDGAELGFTGDCWLRICIQSHSQMTKLSSTLYKILTD